MTIDRRDRIEGVLLGTALGDSLGLPREGLSARRAARIFGDEVRHRLVFGRGMVSDDTEHTCLVAQAWLAAEGAPDRFARSLAWRLRFWLLALPAGVGLGTARAIVKLWLGFSPARSGVQSAGNGPAMRSAILGLLVPGEVGDLRSWVRVQTRVTHVDARAEEGAFAVALAARCADDAGDAAAVLGHLQAQVRDDELVRLLDVVSAHLQSAPADFARAIGAGGGVSGFVHQTVPAALWAWLRHPLDLRAALGDVFALGGDADTTGAIVGALVGATAGAQGLPSDLLDGLWEWPRSVRWMRRLAARLAEDVPVAAGLCWPAIPLRNAVFLAIVLGHGFRRLLPPW